MAKSVFRILCPISTLNSFNFSKFFQSHLQRFLDLNKPKKNCRNSSFKCIKENKKKNETSKQTERRDCLWLANAMYLIALFCILHIFKTVFLCIRKEFVSRSQRTFFHWVQQRKENKIFFLLLSIKPLNFWLSRSVGLKYYYFCLWYKQKQNPCQKKNEILSLTVALGYFLLNKRKKRTSMWFFGVSFTFWNPCAIGLLLSLAECQIELNWLETENKNK